jgi:hypothetical protein
VVFNDKGEFVNLIVAEPTDWVPEGWQLKEIPEGHFWNGAAIVLRAVVNKQVTPEVI